jgi:hypothetical protein
LNKNELIIFDFDFTIAKTAEKIWVWSPRGTRQHENKLYIPVHPTEYQNFILSDDEHIDDSSFKEFYDLDIDKAKPIIPIIEYVDYHTKKPNSDVVVLTARPPDVKEKVFQILTGHKIDVEKINFIGLRNTDNFKKIEKIFELLEENKELNKIKIYEDNINILKLAKQHIKQIELNLILVQSEHRDVSLKFYE